LWPFPANTRVNANGTGAIETPAVLQWFEGNDKLKQTMLAQEPIGRSWRARADRQRPFTRWFSSLHKTFEIEPSRPGVPPPLSHGNSGMQILHGLDSPA